MSEVIHAQLGRANVFRPEDIAQLGASLESALADLGIKDRNDPTTTLVAKLIIQLAKDGDRNPMSLAKRAISRLYLGAHVSVRCPGCAENGNRTERKKDRAKNVSIPRPSEECAEERQGGEQSKCMSSEHFGQLAWQFKRMSGSSGLKVQAAMAC